MEMVCKWDIIYFLIFSLSNGMVFSYFNIYHKTWILNSHLFLLQHYMKIGWSSSTFIKWLTFDQGIYSTVFPYWWMNELPNNDSRNNENQS